MSDQEQASGELGLWRCNLDRAPRRPDWLDVHEKKRAAAFVFEHHRRRYVAAHCFMRGVLGRHLGVDPQQLTFELTAAGKPYLRGECVASFNLSHSEDSAYLAVAPCGDVGIDVEVDRAIENAMKLAETVFSPAELSLLAQNGGRELDRAFLECWTRKEAYVKALAIGIGAVDLRQITVGLAHDTALVRPIAGVTTSSVYIRSLDCGPRERVAVASTVGLPESLAVSDWDGS